MQGSIFCLCYQVAILCQSLSLCPSLPSSLPPLDIWRAAIHQRHSLIIVEQHVACCQGLQLWKATAHTRFDLWCICHHTRVKDALGTKNNQKRICKPKRIHFPCHDFILAGKGIEQFLLRSSSSSIDYVSCLMTKLLHQKTPQDPHLPKAVSQSSLHQAVERLPIEKMEKVIVSGDAAHVKPQLQRSGLRIKINECQGMSSNLEMIWHDSNLEDFNNFNPEPGTFSNRIPVSERVQQKTKWPQLFHHISSYFVPIH